MTYEITYIIKPELTQEEQDSLNQSVSTLIQDLGGEAGQIARTFSVERGGTDENNLRKFAYPIKHYRQGYYYTCEFDLLSDKMRELESTLQRQPEILRFLIVSDFVSLSNIPVEQVSSENIKESKIPSTETKSRKEPSTEDKA